MIRVLVTGASGFVGRALCSALLANHFTVRASSRTAASMPLGDSLEVVTVGDVGANTDWSKALVGVDCVIHCAARAHLKHRTDADVWAAYRAVNVAGAQRLAEQAAALGVQRLVFLSSIGVFGIHSNGRGPFCVSNLPKPVEDYAISKWQAELALRAVSRQTGLQVVVVRSPLVYGTGVKGNFARLLDLVRSGVPLPMAAVNNRRSFIGLDNLVDLLICCVDHPEAAGQTLLVSDGRDLSTPELLHMIANAMGCSLRLVSLPVPLLRLAGRVFGRLNEVDRLVGSLQVDSSATREILAWTPPVSVEQGIKRMVMGAHKA